MRHFNSAEDFQAWADAHLNAMGVCCTCPACGRGREDRRAIFAAAPIYAPAYGDLYAWGVNLDRYDPLQEPIEFGFAVLCACGHFQQFIASDAPLIKPLPVSNSAE